MRLRKIKWLKEKSNGSKVRRAWQVVGEFGLVSGALRHAQYSLNPKS